MRIGTWNLAGRWSAAHRSFLEDADCDIWLLTEVNEQVTLTSHGVHLGGSSMAPGRRWAAVATTLALHPLPDPHATSAAALVSGLTCCSTVLPWSGAGEHFPGSPGTHAERTDEVLRVLDAKLPATDVVWGGDWNVALVGQITTGSRLGKEHVGAFVEGRRWSVPTRHLLFADGVQPSVDHLAMSPDLRADHARRLPALGPNGSRLSDHDAYVVTALRSS